MDAPNFYLIFRYSQGEGLGIVDELLRIWALKHFAARMFYRLQITGNRQLKNTSPAPLHETPGHRSNRFIELPGNW